MSKRADHIWSVELIAKLADDLNDALRRYESYCHEAAAIAPTRWRYFWLEEARAANRMRAHLFHRTTEWLTYASGKQVETLGLIGKRPPASIDELTDDWDAPRREANNDAEE